MPPASASAWLRKRRGDVINAEEVEVRAEAQPWLRPIIIAVPAAAEGDLGPNR